MPLMTGTRLGAYEILGPLEAGGMGEVYRARPESLAREVTEGTEEAASHGGTEKRSKSFPNETPFLRCSV